MAVTEITSKRGEVAVDRGTAGPPAPEARAPADKTPDERVTDPALLPALSEHASYFDEENAGSFLALAGRREPCAV